MAPRQRSVHEPAIDTIEPALPSSPKGVISPNNGTGREQSSENHIGAEAATTYSKERASEGWKTTGAKRCRRRNRASFRWRSTSGEGHFGDENGVVRLRCKPVSIPSSLAFAAARSESSMKTMALTEEILPSV